MYRFRVGTSLNIHFYTGVVVVVVLFVVLVCFLNVIIYLFIYLFIIIFRTDEISLHSKSQSRLAL